MYVCVWGGIHIHECVHTHAEGQSKSLGVLLSIAIGALAGPLVCLPTRLTVLVAAAIFLFLPPNAEVTGMLSSACLFT